MTTEAIEGDPTQVTQTSQSEYSSLPDFNVPAWNSLLGNGTVTAPHLLFKLDHPIRRSSVVSSDASESFKQPCHDFYRRAMWAPDGSVMLAITESQQKHVLDFSRTGVIQRKLQTKSPSPLLDAIWYPVPAIEQSKDDADSIASDHLATCTATWCFAESHRDLPVRLTSSTDSSLRATYSIMNHVEKFVGPHSLAFSPDLCRIYCGLYSCLAVFPLSTPGLNTHSHIPLISAKRSSNGQRGIISAIATVAHPSEPSTHELVAVGTFQGTIGIYDLVPAQFPQPVEHTAMSSYDEQALAQSSCLAGWREVEGEGITQLKFHPRSPYVLFVASRRSNYIYVYDTRYLMGDTSRWSFKPLIEPSKGVRSAHLLAKLRRPGGNSHQRMYFDVDWAGRWIATGDEHGVISLWRIDSERFTDVGTEDEESTVAVELLPDLNWRAHQDAIGSVCFHAHEPWLVSVSGSRHWRDPGSDYDSDSYQDCESSACESPQGGGDQKGAWFSEDSSLKVWNFSKPPSDMAVSCKA
ncbi:related to Guanine nucleotide-binding protein beta 5 [Melanopsichium pennsylvanicum]|uniref:Related to Guanine nucleotide-binding protein beta 5 n=2 Tax=Melanopsichium pennsylvanicum TaxID=63383 RepID=A0AAJ4XP42_9BASI|nr:related to Guanine nucleotide-binding protein beta 5 [Melanopsichium pennsylvanicum]